MHQRYTLVGFFSQASSPSAIFNIEEHDTAAIIFPIKNAYKVLLNEGKTFDCSNSKALSH